MNILVKNQLTMSKLFLFNPQEIALRRFARQKRLAISNDYVVYSLDHERDLSVDKYLVSFKQAMECNNSEKWINVMKEELKSMDDNKVITGI